MKKLGISNLFEALNLVPGVQISRESSGVATVIFRGSTQKGEVKLMIDGISINNSYRGSIYYYLNFPIEMINRIEVIRGPGSILYGSGAISGVINIITNNSQKDTQNKIFTSAGSYNSYNVGTNISTKANNIDISLDSYYQKNKKSIPTGPDKYSNTGESDQHLKDYSVGINISNEKFSFISRLKRSEDGNYYGMFNILDNDLNNLYNINQSFVAQISYQHLFDNKNKIDITTGLNNYQQEIRTTHPSFSIVTGNYQEHSYFTQADFISTLIKDNEFLIGIKYEHHSIIRSDALYSGVQNDLVSPNAKKHTLSFYINDNYNLTNNIDISAGLRYSHYSSTKDTIIPSAGVIFRFTNKLRFKAMYSAAYREPSWIEQKSNPNLNAETSSTIEIGFIYKQNLQNILRINFYKSKINNLIKKDSGGQYVHFNNYYFLGSEIEYIFSPNNKIDLTFIASYIDAKDENKNNVPDVANILSTSSFIYSFDSGVNIGSLLKYTSKSKRSQADTRNDKKSNIIFDQSISYHIDELIISATIKDLFNSGSSYASPINTYPNDLIDTKGRTFFINASLWF
ncbi:MAG: TonB-dependent receptor [Sulfurimonas sp.]|nr:TonB-dependent receptor [Sulfurimonas sp.]